MLKNGLFGMTVAYGYRPFRALIPAALIVILWAGVYECGYRSGLLAPNQRWAHHFANPDADRDAEAELPGGYALAREAERLPAWYPLVTSLVYSADVFLPIVDLHQESYWLPNVRAGRVVCGLWGYECRTGGLLLAMFWGQIVLGWVLTTLFVAGLTRSVRS